MRRRALLSGLAAGTAGIAGCIDLTPSALYTPEIRLCSLLETPASGELAVSPVDEAGSVFTTGFDLAARPTGTETGTPACRAFSGVLPGEDTYRARVDLGGGRSASGEWTADGQHSLQVLVGPDRVRFEELGSAAP